MIKKNTIFIPNGTSPKNIGDAAMLSQLLGLLQKKYPSSEIIVRSFDHEDYHHPRVIFKKRLYQWAAFDTSFLFTKILRTLGLFFACLVAPFPFLYRALPNEIQEELNDYNEASCIVFAPGGYLRSQKGMSQTLNLCMQLLPFVLAKRVHTPSITAPVSIGPFAYSWQEWITMKTLTGIDSLNVREKFSQQLVSRYHMSSTHSTDIALTFPFQATSKRKSKKVLGIVVRDWFREEQHQKSFEKRVSQAVLENVLGTAWVVKPIIQVDASKYGDKDIQATERVKDLLEAAGVRVLPIAHPKTVKEAASIYATCTLLLTVRLHAALIAITQHTPVIALGYEPKTQGVLGDIGLSHWVLPITASANRITNLLEATMKDVRTQKQLLQQSVKKARHIIGAFEEQLDLLYPFEAVTKRIPTVTVAVSAYNEEHNIQAFLRSVQKQKEDGFILKSILVLSDGSTDKTVEKAKRVRGAYPVLVKQYKNRVGKSLRLNELYAQLKTDYLIQSDADVIFSGPHVVRDLIQELKRNPDVGMCGGNPQPLAAETFIEKSVNVTVEMYSKLRKAVRGGNNPFSSDGRLLAFRKTAVKHMTIPETMIANDRFAYYWMKSYGWEYRFVSSAIVYFRSPQTVQDQIRQNTRFVAAPIRLTQYFSDTLIYKEEHIPFPQLVAVLGYACFRYPIHIAVIGIINRYCHLQAYLKEKKLTALWDMATTTKQLGTTSQVKKRTSRQRTNVSVNV